MQDKLSNFELLKHLVETSTVYASILQDRINQANVDRAKRAAREEKAVESGKLVNRKRKRDDEDVLVNPEDLEALKIQKKSRAENGDARPIPMNEKLGDGIQSPRITGAKLRDYQVRLNQPLFLRTLTNINVAGGRSMARHSACERLVFTLLTVSTKLTGFGPGLNGILADQMGCKLSNILGKMCVLMFS